MLDPNLLDGAHRNIRRSSAHSFVGDVDTIQHHPRGTAIASNDGCRGQTSLRGRQHLAVQFLHTGFEPGQIQKPAVRGNLFHLRAIHSAAHFGIFSVDQLGYRSDHALQLDVAGSGCCRLNSDQNVSRLKAFRLHVQHIFSGK